MLALGQLLDVVCRLALVHGPERHVAEQEEARVVGPAGVAVVGRLADHVGEVDALAEHVAGHGGLGRGDPQALRSIGVLKGMFIKVAARKRLLEISFISLQGDHPIILLGDLAAWG